jgi:hypothetical protein
MSSGMLFQEEELISYLAEYQDMPEYSQEDLSPGMTIKQHFICEADLEEYNERNGTSFKWSGGKQSQSAWYPAQEKASLKNLRYISVPGSN